MISSEQQGGTSSNPVGPSVATHGWGRASPPPLDRIAASGYPRGETTSLSAESAGPSTSDSRLAPYRAPVCCPNCTERSNHGSSSWSCRSVRGHGAAMFQIRHFNLGSAMDAGLYGGFTSDDLGENRQWQLSIRSMNIIAKERKGNWHELEGSQCNVCGSKTFHMSKG
ncbi:hypothetical protein CFAM422_007624 [Trichoderma lentiforme]|uniref:Uncharacterized protein n=1 Tax=Trichoderma lentiforme TaxID=1567552 RepID=A0A9P4XDV6_9HYPO|nr:hypothetical protein CFAM422_007624 [Trichoderma lentiforme]